MNKSEKVLSFSPYAFWRLHALYEVAICHNLQWRGHSYDYVNCDGLFTDCDLFWEAMTGPRPAHACAACQTQVKSMLEDCRIPNKWLGKYRTPDCEQVAQTFAQKLNDSELLAAVFKGYPVGDWVKSSVHTHLRINAIDLTNPKHCATLRSYVYSGVVALTCVGSMLEVERPTIMLLYNGRMAITRIALELAKERGIRVVCHERGLAKETLLLWENEGCLSLGPYPKLWSEWGEFPLSGQEVRKVTQWLLDRAHGTNLNWTAFSVLSSLGSLEDFLARHRCKQIWSLFTSSMDEIVSDDEHSSAFGTQNQWIEETIRFVRDQPDIALVIRVHPNSGGKKSMGKNLGEIRFFENLRSTLPDNIAVVMPDDQVSTYALIERTSLGFVYGSTVALEMACRGIRVLLAARSAWMSCSAITLLKDAGSYASLLGEYARKPQTAEEAAQIAKAAYRFAYAYIFRWNIPFPLVSMPNIYSGVLTAKTLDELKPGVYDCLDYCTEIVLGIRRSIPGVTRAVPAGAAEEELSALRHDQKRLAGEPTEAETVGVTVVINVNVAASLRACMRSVANQTFKRIEVVVVYDGQTEEAKAAAEACREEFRCLPVTLVEERNSADPARARNAGIRHAKAPFILPLNAEDKIDPEYLDEVFEVLEKDPAVDVVYSDSLYVTTMGRSRRKPGEFNSGALAGMNQLAYCSVYRRTIWERIGGYRENVSGLEDWDFWIAASLAGASARYLPRVGLVTQPKPNEMSSRPVDEQKLGIAQVMLNNPAAYTEEQLNQSRQLLFQNAIQRAEELMRSGKMSEATALMERARGFATTPEGATRVGEILALLRDFYQESGNGPARAKTAAMQQALAADPDDIESLRTLVALSLDAACWREAARACIKILRQAPNEWDVLRALAHCVRESGDPETAALLRDHVMTVVGDIRLAASSAKVDARGGDIAVDTLEHVAVCTEEPIFGDSEINEIKRLLTVYASDRSDASVTGELFALQEGLVKFIATAETESLVAHLEGSVGHVFALLIESGLPTQAVAKSN